MDVTLTVTASVSDGGTLSYQWYSYPPGGNTAGTLINNAITPSLGLSITSTTATTNYFAVVTNTNTSVDGATTATARSATAVITVVASGSQPVTWHLNDPGAAWPASPAPPPAASVATYGSITKPDDPVRAGYVFYGWYADAGLTAVYAFGGSVTQPLDLYAKWGTAPPSGTYTVSFDTGPGGSSVPPIGNITAGNKITAPGRPATTALPGSVAAGFYPGGAEYKAFGGWYKESGCMNPWDFASDTVTSTTTLYAKWDDPVAVSLDDSAGSNVIEKALSYIRGDTAGEKTFTLILGEDVSSWAGMTSNEYANVSLAGSNFTIKSDRPEGRTVTFTGAGAQIGRTAFYIGGYRGSNNSIHTRTETLALDNITLQGTAGALPGVIVWYGGTLKLLGNSKITGFTNTTYTEEEGPGGGGVYAVGTSGEGGGAYIIMQGNSEISDNRNEINGEGFNFTRGGNHTFGGVKLGEYSTLTMSDNAAIKNNTAHITNCSGYISSQGGGVYAADNTAITMSGHAEISGNTASSSAGGDTGGVGGGVYTEYSTITMSDYAKISGNTASSSAGGVVGNVIIMSDNTEISGNTAASFNGGGVLVISEATMSGNAKISGNTASSSAGGVFSYGTITMSGNAEIRDNTAGENGGGVNGTLTMSGSAVIRDNTATSGGGVYISGGTFTLNSNARISGNTASGNGGGVYLYTGSYYNADSLFVMNGGTISSNKAGGNGGGVYVSDSGYDKVAFTLSGGTVYGSGDTTAGANANILTGGGYGAALYKTTNGIATWGGGDANPIPLADDSARGTSKTLIGGTPSGTVRP